MGDALFREKVPGLMRRFMADFACSKEDAAAVFGNAGHECAGFTKLQEIKPTIAGSRGGYGWFQWTGPRRKQFEAYCARNGIPPNSDKANYNWLWLELHNSEKGAVAAVRKAGTLRQKVEAFELAYERAGVKHYDSRERWARIALAAFDAAKIVPVPPAPQKPAAEPAKSWLSVLVEALTKAFRK